MHTCEFCTTPLDRKEPQNIALLYHLGTSPDCKEQFLFQIENTNVSWTMSSSGAA